MSQRTRVVQPRRPIVPPSLAHRVPPGQIVTARWPVLHQGEIPDFDQQTWDIRVWGAVEQPLTLDWTRFRELPVVTISGDLHCVTRWSTLDHEWSGVRPASIGGLAKPLPAARFVILHGDGGYTANLPVEVFFAEDVILATHHGGDPLEPRHGAPLRAVVPSRYAWKSVKWLRGIEFTREDQPGFWEQFGYNNSANPWLEERFES